MFRKEGKHLRSGDFQPPPLRRNKSPSENPPRRFLKYSDVIEAVAGNFRGGLPNPKGTSRPGLELFLLSLRHRKRGGWKPRYVTSRHLACRNWASSEPLRTSYHTVTNVPSSHSTVEGYPKSEFSPSPEMTNGSLQLLPSS